MPSVLTIAGSDPSGGAGIQADLRVFDAFGAAGLSAMTALTVQNSLGVQSIFPVAAEVLAAQLEAVLQDTRPDAVKIGMLGGAAQVAAVADSLRHFSLPWIVLDPVLASTGGIPLLDDAGRQALIHDLLPLCHLVTPNLEEALRVPEKAGVARLVKGGHRAGAPLDVLTLPDGAVIEFDGTRIDTPHTHGTGCFLSSAIAAFLAQGAGLSEAVRAAKTRLEEALQTPVNIGQGRGYPCLSSLTTPDLPRKAISGLYVVTDTHLRPDHSSVEIAHAAFAGGAHIVQLRDKSLPTPDAVRIARQMKAVANEWGGLFLVNDRVDVALAAGADGVHLGPDDLPPADARRLLGPHKIIGASVSSVAEARPLAPFVSYFGVGAIFGSQTKTDAGEAVGTVRIRAIRDAFPTIPIAAIGGIHTGNIAEVARAGASSAAVVSAVVTAPDMTEAVRELARRFDAATR